MQNKNLKTILIVSNEPWGKIWFSKQHYAYELRKLGHTVYFINPTSKWKFKNLFSFSINLKNNEEGIIEINYKNNFPQIIFRRFFTRLNDFVTLQKINQKVSLKNPDLIWWKFEPYRFLSTFHFTKNKKIYHVVDPYHFLWQDKQQVKDADLIVCTNPKYYEYYKENYSTKEIILVPHGISEDELIPDYQQTKLIQEKYGNFSILVGTISKDLNLNLLQDIENEKIKTLILGLEVEKSDKWNNIKSSTSIIFLGEIHAKEIKNYIAAASVCIIAYNYRNNLDKYTRTPLKVINYLAQNKPIVSSLVTSLYNLENKAIYYSNDSGEFIRLVKEGMANRLYVDKDLVNKYLNELRYPFLINKILNIIN